MKHASFEVRKDIYNGILIIDIYLDLKRFDLPILESFSNVIHARLYRQFGIPQNLYLS